MLLFSAFTSKPVSLTATNLFLFVVRVEQNLMFPIQSQHFLVLLGLPHGTLYGKIEKKSRQTISLLQSIPNRTCARQQFTCADFTTGFF
jgi:hypothetical protein